MVKRTFRRKNLKSRRRSSKKLTRKSRKNFLWGGFAQSLSANTSGLHELQQIEHQVAVDRYKQIQMNDANFKAAVEDAPSDTNFDVWFFLKTIRSQFISNADTKVTMAFRYWGASNYDDAKKKKVIKQLIDKINYFIEQNDTTSFYEVIPKKTCTQDMYKNLPDTHETYNRYKAMFKR